MFSRILALLVALSAVVTAPEPNAAQNALATGVRQVQDGEFEAALATLDLAARELSKDPSRVRDVARAYAYMGVAYLGLRQDGLARSRFLRALSLDRDLRLSPDEFSARSIRAFEAAREESRQEASLAKEARKKRGKGGLILLGVGGATAVGVGVAVTRPHTAANLPRTATITVGPEGTLVAATTRATFTATGTDPDGDALTYRWDFGAQGVQPETGPTATRIFPSIGTFQVSLTVSDGRASARLSTTVVTGSVTGTWRMDKRGQAAGESRYRLEQHCDPECADGLSVVEVFAAERLVVKADNQGHLEDPRRIMLNYATQDRQARCDVRLEGDLDRSLQTITGQYSCTGNEGCACTRVIPVTLTRQ